MNSVLTFYRIANCFLKNLSLYADLSARNLVILVMFYMRIQQWTSNASVPSSMGLLAQAATLHTSGSPSAAVSAAGGNASDTKRARFAPDLSALASATSSPAIASTSGSGTGPKPGAPSTYTSPSITGHSQLQSARVSKGDLKTSGSASSGTPAAGSGTQGSQSTAAGARGVAGSGGGGIRGITTSTAHPSSRDSSPDSSRGSLDGHSDSSTSASPGPRHAGKSISAFVYHTVCNLHCTI